MYELRELSLKFERHLVSEIVNFEVFSLVLLSFLCMLLVMTNILLLICECKFLAYMLALPLEFFCLVDVVLLSNEITHSPFIRLVNLYSCIMSFHNKEEVISVQSLSPAVYFFTVQGGLCQGYSYSYLRWIRV